MLADGYDAIFDADGNGGNGEITLKATGVNGISSTDTKAGVAFNLGGVTAPSNGSAAVASTLELGSADKIGISGNTADQLFGSGVIGAGGTSALTSVESIDISGSTSAGAQDAIKTIDAALAQIDSQRASLGAVQNRFGHTISNLANVSENVSASRSRIQDTDFAVETANLTKNQILQQAGTSILSQANQLPQAAISLLGG
ncbi:flagellin [Pseudoalteromonas sp. T1lg75]|uniref:flagellin n=1 Tax=Pseudoalteromonas sp. T1lg75 TaxID=2077102 RepID=UPI003FA3CAA3